MLNVDLGGIGILQPCLDSVLVEIFLLRDPINYSLGVYITTIISRVSQDLKTIILVICGNVVD